MIELTTEQEKRAVELFAQGLNRSEVVNNFIDTYPELEEKAEDAKQLRKDLSDKLRSCDPSSTRFAIAKHKSHYETHLTAMKKAISNAYQNLVIKSIMSIEKSIADIETRMQDIQHNLDAAMETTPVGSAEYISMMNAMMNLDKRRMELEDKKLERMERIHQQTIEF